jgi:hypothetical protein
MCGCLMSSILASDLDFNCQGKGQCSWHFKTRWNKSVWLLLRNIILLEFPLNFRGFQRALKYVKNISSVTHQVSGMKTSLFLLTNYFYFV